jgi:lipoprotein-releasing system permease protein
LTKNFSLFLALRYLRPKRTFVSVITLISVLGVTLGVGVLIFVISVMAGFHAQIKDLALGYDSHIDVRDVWGTSMFDESRRPPDVKEESWRDVREALEKVPGVTSVTPIVQGMLLVEAFDNVAPAAMLGIRQDDADTFFEKYKKLIKTGELELTENHIVLDVRLARAWSLQVGDTVSVWPTTNLSEMMRAQRAMQEAPPEERKQIEDYLKEVTQAVELTVTGTFEAPSLADMSDLSVVLVPLHVARELRGMEDGVTSLAIELTDAYKAPVIKHDYLLPSPTSVLPENWQATTWIEQHQVLFDSVQNEMDMMYVVLYFIVLVAAFCVMNTMITVTVQKRREIGIISALGARSGQTVWVFLIQGMIVGGLGALTGLAAGLGVLALRNDIRAGIASLTGREIFSQETYGLVEIPAKVVPYDVMVICVGAFVLCTLAALVPAFIAARTEPAVALRD